MSFAPKNLATLTPLWHKPCNSTPPQRRRWVKLFGGGGKISEIVEFFGIIFPLRWRRREKSPFYPIFRRNWGGKTLFCHPCPGIGESFAPPPPFDPQTCASAPLPHGKSESKQGIGKCLKSPWIRPLYLTVFTSFLWEVTCRSLSVISSHCSKQVIFVQFFFENAWNLEKIAKSFSKFWQILERIEGHKHPSFENVWNLAKYEKGVVMGAWVLYNPGTNPPNASDMNCTNFSTC